MATEPLFSPLRFHHVYKDYPWGGTRIAERFGRTDTPPVCAESWEVSAHPNGKSFVLDGPLAGIALDELSIHFGRSLLGSNSPNPNRFPLLFKIIDAHRNLSVQVHPSPADPTALPGDIKNECWFLLGDTPTAGLYAGFRDGVDKESLTKALETGTPRVDSMLRQFPARKEESIFIHSGLVHAIGAGCLIYEVQQSADVTYRFYDWDRVDAQGRSRPLHIPEALRSIDWGLPPVRLATPKPCLETPGLSFCVRTPYFTLHRLFPEKKMRLRTNWESFHVIFVDRGSLLLSTKGGEMAVKEGTSALIPAAADSYEVTPLVPGSAALLTHL